MQWIKMVSENYSEKSYGIRWVNGREGVDTDRLKQPVFLSNQKFNEFV